MTLHTRKARSFRRWPLLATAGGLLLAAAGLLGLARPAPAAQPGPGLTPPTAPAPVVRPAQAPAAVPQPPASALTAPLPAAIPARQTPLAQPIRYAAIGASDTVGVGTVDPPRLNWTARLRAQLPPDTVYERFARNGITLNDALRTEVPAAIRFQPTLVTVWLVVNDALRGAPLPLYQQELKMMLDQLTTQTSATVVLLNAPDIANALQPSAPAATRRQIQAVAAQWNAAIARTAAPYGGRVEIVDLFGPSDQAAAHPEWLSPDNFHPSAAGYQVIADLTAGTLRRTGLIP